MIFNILDWIIVGLYCIGIISLATYVSRTSIGKERTAEDYFLAGRSLPWTIAVVNTLALTLNVKKYPLIQRHKILLPILCRTQLGFGSDDFLIMRRRHFLFK